VSVPRLGLAGLCSAEIWKLLSIHLSSKFHLKSLASEIERYTIMERMSKANGKSITTHMFNLL
jgi:hypothetical protein